MDCIWDGEMERAKEKRKYGDVVATLGCVYGVATLGGVDAFMLVVRCGDDFGQIARIFGMVLGGARKAYVGGDEFWADPP